MGSLVLKPERDEWNYGMIAEVGSAAMPTSAAAETDGSTRRAVLRTVAAVLWEK